MDGVFVVTLCLQYQQKNHLVFFCPPKLRAYTFTFYLSERVELILFFYSSATIDASGTATKVGRYVNSPCSCMRKRSRQMGVNSSKINQ